LVLKRSPHLGFCFYDCFSMILLVLLSLIFACFALFIVLVLVAVVIILLQYTNGTFYDKIGCLEL